MACGGDVRTRIRRRCRRRDDAIVRSRMLWLLHVLVPENTHRMSLWQRMSNTSKQRHCLLRKYTCLCQDGGVSNQRNQETKTDYVDSRYGPI